MLASGWLFMLKRLAVFLSKVVASSSFPERSRGVMPMPRGKAFGKAVRLDLTAAVMLGAAVLPVRAQAILSIGFNSSIGSVQAVGTRVLHEEIDRRLPGRFLVDERGGPSVGS